ncbi:hypothetical protein Tco_1278832 [Tanacetum coccineum]
MEQMRLSIRRGDSVEKAITTDVNLDSTQDSYNIIKTQSTVMPNVDIPQEIDVGGSPKRQETMRGTGTDIQKQSQKTTKPSTGWKRQSQIEAKVSQSQKSAK